MKLLGVVFAGGLSSRMGRPKALLPWPRAAGEDTTFISRAVHWLGGQCTVVEVAAGAQWSEISRTLPEAAGFPFLEDAEPGVGPLGGLVAALERCVELGLDGALVLACDMPLVEESDVTPLIARLREGADIALWSVDGFEQPLCAVYGVRAAQAARLALDNKARRPVAIFDALAADGRPLRVDRLIPDKNSRVRLMNVNTPRDYDLARRRFHECQGRTASSPSGPDRR